MNRLDFNVATPNLSYPVFKASPCYKHVYLKPSNEPVKTGKNIFGKLIHRFKSLKHRFQTRNNSAERFHEMSENSLRNIGDFLDNKKVN